MSTMATYQNKTHNPEATRKLTSRQKQCLQRVATGATVHMIAKQLGITERMVRGHLHNTRKRLEAHSTAEAIYIALKMDILE